MVTKNVKYSMKEKLRLDNVTIVAVACNKIGETISALYKCLGQVTPFKTILFTDHVMPLGNIIEVVKIPKLDWKGYNTFIVKELYKYIETDYCLIVQHDGYILDATQWDNEFYNYDVVAAKWQYSDGRNIGNGGFKLTTKKLLTILGADEKIEITYPEDEIIGRLYRHYLEKNYDIKFCSEEIADKFSFELNEPINPTFGFHAYHHKSYQETIVIKRNHAIGDIIMCEPVLEYFHKQGYKVAIDTQPEFYQIYQQHYFPVYFKDSLNKKIKYREINLDMAYENKPKQLALKSYFETAGITNEPLRNSLLNIYSGGDEKFFKKYVVIHIDNTSMEYRNVHGVDWKKVVSFLKRKGYEVFQVGRGDSLNIVTKFNTMTLQMLMVFVKGADLFIGSDSGVAQIAVGFNIPSVIFFGSVNPHFRYHNLDKIKVIQSDCPDNKKKNCYHEKKGRVIGSKCTFNELLPPCTTYNYSEVISKIKELL